MTQESLIIAATKIDFKTFVLAHWDAVEPGNRLEWTWHMDCISTHLKNLPTIRRCIFNIGRKKLKSLLISCFFPAWVWTTRPNEKFLCASHTKQLANELADKCRLIVSSKKYQAWYGIQIRDDKSAVSRFVLEGFQGSRQTTSIDSRITGATASIVLVDDPNDADSYASKADRDAVINCYHTVLATSFLNRKTSQTVLVQQRCGLEDLSGHLLETEKDNWCHVCLPTQFDPLNRCVTPYFTDPRTTELELINDRIDLKELESLKTNPPKARIWACQENQQPSNAEGNLLPVKNIKTFDDSTDEVEENGKKRTRQIYCVGGKVFEKRECDRVIGVDLAISQGGDYTVFAVADITPARDLILVDIFRGRYNAEKTINMIKQLYMEYKPRTFIIETYAYQAFLENLVAGDGYPTMPMHLPKDKVNRAGSLEIKMAQGKFFVPKQANWLKDFMEEASAFPDTKWDDQVDSCAMTAIEAMRIAQWDPEPVRELTEEEKQKEEDKRWWKMFWRGVI